MPVLVHRNCDVPVAGTYQELIDRIDHIHVNEIRHGRVNDQMAVGRDLSALFDQWFVQKTDTLSESKQIVVSIMHDHDGTVKN